MIGRDRSPIPRGYHASDEPLGRSLPASAGVFSGATAQIFSPARPSRWARLGESAKTRAPGPPQISVFPRWRTPMRTRNGLAVAAFPCLLALMGCKSATAPAQSEAAAKTSDLAATATAAPVNIPATPGKDDKPIAT